MRNLFLLIPCLFFTTLLFSGDDRTRYFEANQEIKDNYIEFSLTSLDAELYHDRHRVQWMKKIKELGFLSRGETVDYEEIENWGDEMKRSFREWWESFFSDIDPADGSLYIIQYVSEEKEFSGYYFLKNGALVKKSVYEF